MALELTFIPALAIILIAAAVGRLISRALKQPAILGELILGIAAGIFIGFSTAGGVTHEPLFNVAGIAAESFEPIARLADIGIILLLFLTGLTINLREFKKLEVASASVAGLGVIVPFILGYLVTIGFGFSNIVALFVGVALVATSIGFSASILAEMGMLRSRIGTLILGAAVIDDVIGIVLISTIVGLTVTGTVQFVEVLLPVLLLLSFFVISLTAGIRVFRKFSERVGLGRENLLMLGLIVVLLFGLVTQEIGMAAIIGAFVAGLIIGQSHYARRLREHISLIGGGFFIPIFFVTMGMNLDIGVFTSVNIGAFAVALVIVAIAGKIIGCGLGARISKFSGRESLAVGVAMIPRAGVELVLIKLGLDHGIIGTDVASAILLVVMTTVLIAPTALWKALKNVRKQGKA